MVFGKVFQCCRKYMARVWGRCVLAHPPVELTLYVLVIINEVLIITQTPVMLPWNSQFWLSYIIDSVVLVALVTEVLLKFLRGFWLHWKDGCFICGFFFLGCVTAGLLILTLADHKVFSILRVMRLLQTCRLVRELGWILQYIFEVEPELCNITFILFNSVLTFSVLGVILFGKSVPTHFGDLGKALYSVFNCIVMDSWLDIYKAFQEEEQTLKIRAAIYFIVFIIANTYICANLMLAIVTSSLWEFLFASAKEERWEQGLSVEESQALWWWPSEETAWLENSSTILPACLRRILLGGGEGNTNPQLSLKVMRDKLTYSKLSKLSEEILCEVKHILESNKNIREYEKILEKFNLTDKEVKSITLFMMQDHEMTYQKPLHTIILDNHDPSEVTSVVHGDTTSTSSKPEEEVSSEESPSLHVNTLIPDLDKELPHAGEERDREKGDGEQGDGEERNGDEHDGEKGDGEERNGEKGDGEKGDGEERNGEKGDGEKGDGEEHNGEKGNGEEHVREKDAGEKGDGEEGAGEHSDGEENDGEENDGENGGGEEPDDGKESGDGEEPEDREEPSSVAQCPRQD